MNNKQFQRILRREVKLIKREFLQDEEHPKSYRQWNLYKVQLKGLQEVLKKFPEIETEEFEELIRLNPTTLKFLNDCLNVIPNMLEQLMLNDYQYIFEQFYMVKRKELDRIRDEKREERLLTK